MSESRRRQKILYTDNRFATTTSVYDHMELVDKNETAEATGRRIADDLIQLHSIRQRSFRVTLFFRDPGHTLDIVEAVRNREEELRETEIVLPNTILIMARNYREQTPEIEIPLPSQEEV